MKPIFINQQNDLITLKATALEAAANGVLIIDRDGCILWANPAITGLTGYTLSELVGQNPRIFKSGVHPLEYFRDLWDTILSGKVWQNETINQRKDGSLYTEEQTIAPVLDSSGAVTHFIAIKQDITHRKQVESTMERDPEHLFAILDGIPAMVYLKSPDYRIHFANRMFRDYFGDPQGKLCYQILHSLDTPCDNCLTHAVFTTRQPIHWERQSTDGRVFQIYDYPFTDIDGNNLVLELITDITELSQANTKLEQLNQELLTLSQTERTQRKLVEALFRASLVINSSLELDAVLDQILEQTQTAIPCKAAALLFITDNKFYPVRHRGLSDIPSISQLLHRDSLLSDYRQLQILTETHQPVIISNRFGDSEQQDISGMEWVHSFAAAPLLHHDKLLGIILLLSDQTNYFTPLDGDALQTFANQAALAIQNARLFEQVQENRNQLVSLSHRLVEVQENERQQIARELHDEAGQALTSLKVALRLLELQSGDPSKVQEIVVQVRQQLDALMYELHRLAANLRPAILDQFGLIPAIQQHLESVNEIYGLKVHFADIGIENRLPHNLEINLYRMVQEALTNVIRHSQATQVDILLELHSNRLILIIEDNGVGFDPTIEQKGGGLGLFGMLERTEMLGGHLVIESKPGKGTTLYIEIPHAN